ncbi:hypothetical protein Ahy_A10g047220 isoform B [Arachis hypogaea]|uniref:Uncharacterized protein n=1 Tax=Arachis hypogaea TaxID=3818 RepID=A0A445B209_ARAHY|nr:hypothetical protein Ahy_A10g047220 isoform B [Arachis hypogaea]
MAAEAVLSSVLSVVFDRMSSPEVVNWIKGKKLTQNLIERLKTNLYAVQAFLIDAEQKQIKERPVKNWLDSLKDAMYVADDLLDEVFTKAATQKEPGTFLSRFLNLQDRDVANRMEEMENAPCILLSKLKYLRALSFNGFPLESLPDSIGELIHLRYLDLCYTRIMTLPDTLCNLYNLQTLKLVGCWKLTALPVSTKDLTNLRYLDITQTRLHEMPEGMSKLTSLQVLSRYVVGKREGNKINELGALANLHQTIFIDELENVVNSSEALEARMFDKDGIESLILKWSPDEYENTLRPHSNLKRLEIYCYRGTTFPDWLGHCSYHNITQITLGSNFWGHFRNCCMLPSLGQLPSLKHLEISMFERLAIVGAEFYRNDESCLETPFPMLETLTFESMPCWEEWRSLEFNAFPRLRELIIMDCPMLRGDLPNQLPSLQSLQIGNCKQLSCCVPRAPAITSLRVEGNNEVRIGELPPLLDKLSINGKHQAESVMEAIAHTQLTCLTSLSISDCSSHVLFPVSSIPASLQKLRILDCKKLEFEMEGQHHSLHKLMIQNSCDSVTSFSLDSFPNLVRVKISKCKKMEYLVVSRSLSCLRSLEIENCGSLKSLQTLWMASPQLEDLILLGCPEIDLSATGDPHRSLRDLTISCYEKQLSCVASQFHGLTYLCIKGENESVKCLPKEGWLPATLESLRLEFITSVKMLECKGLAHLTSLQELTMNHCYNLENIDGEKLPASLLRLIINGGRLGKRCEMKDPQVWPKISHIPAIYKATEQPGTIMDTIQEIQEWHDTLIDIERNPNELHQLFSGTYPFQD